MGRNLYKLTKSFDDVIIMLIYDVIKMRQLKNSSFLRVSADYLKNCSTDFQQTYVSFRQVYIEVFEIKRLKIDHLLLPW